MGRELKTARRALACALVLWVSFGLPVRAAAPAAADHPYTNRLIDSNNPYLLLHAHNPVDWYPWGPEALEKAKREGKPIFLSVGYSTCYWCHVAERTLFSNPEIAQLMNDWFVNIKVDREERPDLDAVYMLATQLITSGPGGWPNNVFLTPELKPFYAGGYFPPEDDQSGRPGFPSVLKSVHEEWTQRPERIQQRAEGIVSVLRQIQDKPSTTAMPEPREWRERSRAMLLPLFDTQEASTGAARRSTKFPRSPALDLLLTDYRLERRADTLRALTVTLDAMAYGGIYDQLGGGFHRYATERTWSIPHFEKMLYDNAQLLAVYARAWELTRRPEYKRIALGVRDFLHRELSAPDGGFYTALDAAVGGEEGLSYIWAPAEIDDVLGGDAVKFFEIYVLAPLPSAVDAGDVDAGDVHPMEPEHARGVLRVRPPAEADVVRVEAQIAALQPQRAKLLRARGTRDQPARDEKLLVGLNGLAIEAFAVSARTFRNRQDLDAARRAAGRIWTMAWDAKHGRLSHAVFQGRAQGDGFLEDYALLGRGLLSLAQAGGGTQWLDRSRLLADALLRRFDPDGDGRLAVSASTEQLILAPPEQGDEPYPSGTSASVDLLARLAKAIGIRRYAEAAERIARQTRGRPEQWPTLVASISANNLFAAATTVRAGTPQTSSDPGQTASHVRATAAVRRSKDADEIVVTLEIEKGFHINANPASFDFLVPTTVTFAGLSPLEIRYAPPLPFKSSFAPDTLNVYEGKVQAVAQFKKGALDGLHALKATVHAQACTESVCLPPSRIPLTVRLTRR